ncbi:hypothetical protein QYE76_041453 [Lolium multiflorum]|uniref:Transposase-associated domain-containing protein n=1 Tax=Lolium multiflorum TaxID=4521 RepID=A0AAD8TDN4_LOLMU|nr:hypothetical protein QYE76_041453 [Lolium multiflorum]
MYGNRCAPAFREGVNSFLLVAEANKSKQGFMCCPCLKCKNEKDYSCSRDIKSHLLRFGFMSSYNVWTKHGEEGVMMEDGDEEEDNDDQYRSMFSECDDTAMDDNEEEGGEEQAADDPVDDDLRRAISDARRDCGTDKERLQFDKMLEDHHKLLYPGCEDGQRKLGSILELLKWKAEVGVTDSGFEKLMIILKKLFPRNNELPVSTYEAKKLVCPLGLDVQKIHACINDCILYRGEKYENLNKCPICGALRYKIRKDDPGDVEGEPPRKRVPAKVMWKIFGIYVKGLIFPEESRSQKGRLGGGPGPQTVGRRGLEGARRPSVWPPRPASDAPFGLLKGFDLKTRDEKSKSPETIQYAATVAKLRLGTETPFGTPPDGELEGIITAITTDASPSTSHVSPIHV